MARATFAWGKQHMAQISAQKGIKAPASGISTALNKMPHGLSQPASLKGYANHGSKLILN